MRKGLAIGMAALMMFLAFAIICPTASAAFDVIDEVDIGDPTSESSHSVLGWGPIEPASHGGGWGGAASGILTTGDTDLRTTWAPSIGDDDPSASVTLSTGDYIGTTISIIALDGLADDSFDVFIDGELYFSYSWSGNTAEFWVKHCIPVYIESSTTITLTITATGNAWGGINTYGQLGIAHIALLGYESGFNDYGYNYNSHMFRGYYANAYLGKDGFPPYEGDTDAYLAENPEAASKWYWQYRDTWLMMKWSDTWLSNQDRNCDGLLDRGNEEPYANSAAEGAWLTNHMRGRDENGKRWTYFVKIVYPTGGPVDENNDGYDDVTGGEIIWGSFIISKQVESSLGCTDHINPEGWGAL
jgi:hypothetical protein